MEKVLKWVHSVGHLDDVGFVGDSEEAIVSLVTAIVETRRKMNRKTHDQNNKPYQKGRTARVERFIQKLRNQTVCLVRAVEKKLGIEIPEGHAMWAWRLCHASWLLNRCHRHAAIGSTPYQSVVGRPYVGKIAPFGQYVFALKKPEKKGTANCIGGIFLGKNAQDLRLVGVEDGILATGSVRRIATGWRKEPVLNLSVTPWNPKKPKGTFVKQPLPAPALASIAEEASAQEPVIRMGDRGQSRDEQLEEVLDMLASDLSVSNGGTASSATSSASDIQGGQGEEPVSDDMMLDELKKRTLESTQLESEESAAKKTREGESSEPSSPSRALYPPLFAGRVSQEEDVFHWDEHEDLTAVEGEDVEYEDLMEEEMEDAPKNEQGETPPELRSEALDAMDQEAAVEELNRLSKIGVIEEFVESCAKRSVWTCEKSTTGDFATTDGYAGAAGLWYRKCAVYGQIWQLWVWSRSIPKVATAYFTKKAVDMFKMYRVLEVSGIWQRKQHGSKATARVTFAGRKLDLEGRKSEQRKKRVPWMMMNGSLPKRRVQRTEVVPSDVLGAVKEYAQGTK